MDFFFVILLALFWFVRPQDVIPGLSGFPFVRYIMMGALVAMFRREEGFDWRTLFRNPIDILLACYLGWIVYAADDHIDTAKKVFDFAAFYWCTALALGTTGRFKKYLSVWLAALLCIAGLAVASLYGLDLVMGTIERTSYFKGRLALMTWLHNNPNSLGHGVVIVIPMAYAWLWRGGTAFRRALCLIACGLAGYCVYATASKGAYLVGLGTLMAAMIFGRNWKLQVAIVALGLTAGVAAIKMLPRMDTLDRNEGGIAGRLLIWQMAKSTMENTGTGVGMKQYRAVVVSEVRKGATITESRDTHGSYVAIGAELGYGGLFCYVGLIYAALRALFQGKTGGDPDLDRIRCTLFVLIIGYAFSAWMINKEYHTDYFLMLGAVSGFHRLVCRRADESLPENKASPLELASFGGFAPRLALQSVGGSVPSLPAWMMEIAATGRLGGSISATASSPEPMVEYESGTLARMTWRKFDMLDGVMLIACFQLTLYLWEYLSTEFFSL